MAESHQEQRLHKRVQIELGVRFLLANGAEHAGSVLNISAGGVLIAAQIVPKIGDRVIVYVDEIGRLEGNVVRTGENSFALILTVPQVKRERIVETLTFLLNRNPDHLDENRRATRVPSTTVGRCSMPDGRELPCRIIDLSLTGVSLEIMSRPAIGESVMVGRMRGRVARHHATGIAVEFLDVAPRGSLSEQLAHSANSAESTRP